MEHHHIGKVSALSVMTSSVKVNISSEVQSYLSKRAPKRRLTVNESNSAAQAVVDS
ncbi:hypothetical protein PAXRUDRAFT_821474 [Paxillus rubicundulus Ve08.2h10]|uniref:Uncharacterized protein n=1 Tax=Paxillus rubicundulus Ve08.2h10 TaxID=930991 RepID=A0A0D0EAT9_9AGAM|nr:hypothetical protein PAXRUDRAFT_821474 [Paxillus rubicundulus Ve08.2h10]